MKKSRWILGIVVFAVICVSALWASPSEVGSDNAVVREAAVAEILQQRQQTITGLEEVVKNNIQKPTKANWEAAKAAVILLGKLHATEAIPLLVDNLLFVCRDPSISHETMPEERMPCVAALIEIGSPALDDLLEKVATTDDSQKQIYSEDNRRRFYSEYVFVSVLGRTAALAYVQEDIKGDTDPVRIERMAKFVSELRVFEPKQREDTSYGTFSAPKP